MASTKGRKCANWSGSPAGWLVRCIIQIYYKRGQRQHTVAQSLYRHVPRDLLTSIIGREVTDNAIDQRGHKGQFDKNEFEHPDKNPVGIRMMPAAAEIVRTDRVLDWDAVQEIIGDARSAEAPVVVLEDLPSSTAVEETSGSGLVYFGGIPGSEHCCVGITTKNWVEDRIKAFRKGTIGADLDIVHVLVVANVKKFDRAFKRAMSIDHLSKERYRIPPGDAFRRAKIVCNDNGLFYYESNAHRALAEAAE